MPQMSPLGWIWLVVLVVFGYFLIMMMLYYLYYIDFFLKINISGGEGFKWWW